MGLIKDIIGLAIIFVAWFNLFKLELPVQMALFILGFDAMGLIAKILLFVLNLFFPLFGSAGSLLVWTLALMVGVEILLSFLNILSSLIVIIKPLFVFLAIFFGTNNLQLALIFAGIDFILNLKH